MNTGDVIFASIFVIMGIVNVKIIFDTAARNVANAGKAFALYFFSGYGPLCAVLSCPFFLL